jgi:hypothetical protein
MQLKEEEPMHIRSRWVLAALAAISLATAGAVSARAAAEGSFQRALQVSGPVDIDVSTGSGNITVRAGAAGTVEIRGKIRANSDWRGSESEAEERVRYLETHPPIEQDGNSIRIGHITDHDLTRNISISYEIVAPAETSLHAQTGSGSQTIAGIRGPVEVGSGSGDLAISNIGAEVHATTGSGDIKLEAVQGSLHARTGSGSIRGSGIAGAMVASTGSGSVRLEQTAAGDSRVSTGSGDVELSGIRGALQARTGSGEIRAQGAPTGEWSLHSGSGSLTVRLPEQAAFELNARTDSGNIQTAHPITVMGTIGKRQLRGTVRGGGPLLDLSTSSGNIHIE